MRSARKYINYCWKDSKVLSKESGKGRLWLFYDMVKFGFRYESTTIKYKKLNYFALTKEEREKVHSDLMNTKANTLYHYNLLKFLSKYASLKYEHPRNMSKRLAAYTKMFNMGKNCSVRYNCWIMTTHDCIGELKIGNNCSFGRNTEIDFTGGLIIGNGVDIAERCMILTHGHQYFGNRMDSKLISGTNGAYPTPLSIEDNVFIGAGTYIMPGVKRIGENSIISAGSMVYKQVPPNCVVAGNPAKVIFEMPEGYRTYFKYKKHL